MLIVAVLAALAFGLYRAATDGRFRGTHRLPTPVEERASVSASVEQRAPAGVSQPAVPEDPTPTPTLVDLAAGTGLDLELGERATLLQFSSAFCAPCRATRRTLADVAAVVPGFRHVEVDAEHHLDLVRRLGILRTPTTLILDSHGREVSRAAGAPAKDAVLATLARAIAP